jgi:NAD(P)-dependent dehydrogenase (short-subunit alcohol dehydrogenase family)
LAGRVAPVTGGTRGIGAAIARSLATQGATVAAGYNRGLSSAQQFVADLTQTTTLHGAPTSAHQGNVGSAADCRRTIEEAIETHGRLDILVNNAGITMDRTVAKMTEEEWYTVLAVNLSGAFFLSQATLAHMLQRGTGRIVNVSSFVAETGNIGQANYTASKSGLFGLTKTLAKEAAHQLAKSGKRTDDGIGITVNTVTPGLIATATGPADPKSTPPGVFWYDPTAMSYGAAPPRDRTGRNSCPTPSTGHWGSSPSDSTHETHCPATLSVSPERFGRRCLDE